MKPPDNPGLYWVKTGNYKWWNAIVCVEGERPFLCIGSVWYPGETFEGDRGTVASIRLEDISEWGYKIHDPNK